MAGIDGGAILTKYCDSAQIPLPVNGRYLLQELQTSTGLYLVVPRGQLTFEAEGVENPGSPYHSRIATVPSDTSGITIGRGLDLGQFDRETVGTLLKSAGFDRQFIIKAQLAAGYIGGSARSYLRRNPIRPISLPEQWQLFNVTRAYMEDDVKRILEKNDVVEQYGTVNWEGLPCALQDLLVDLRYRGDYTSAVREKLQPLLEKSHQREIVSLMADYEFWVKRYRVPEQRFMIRKQFADLNLSAGAIGY